MALNIIASASLSPTTKSTYSGTCRLLSQLLEFDVGSLSAFKARLNTPEESYDAIKERWPDPATRNRVLTTILAVVRHANLDLTPRALTTWKHIHWVLTRNNGRRNGRMSEKEAAAWVPFNEICKRREELAVSEYGSMNHLFLSWYSLWAPNRADFFRTYIFRTEKEVPPGLRKWMHYRPPEHGNGTVTGRKISAALKGGGVHTMSTRHRDPRMPHANFIVLQPSSPREWTFAHPKPSFIDTWDSAPRLVLLSHKTASSHGRIIRAIPPALCDVLDASLKQMPRNVLFVRSDSQPFASSHSFTVWGERILEKEFDGRRLGFNGLRHSYISNVDYNRSSPQQLATLARDMGHSEFQQRRYTRGTFKEGRDPAMKVGGRKRPRVDED